MRKKQLEAAIDLAVIEVKRLDFSNADVYASWMAQAYYFVRHSTPMLALSCGLSIENRAYHLRCISHLAEEKGHDRMLLADLKQLDRKIEDYPEFSSTKAFYQTQYYWIEHVNPVSFLGYILVLEGLAVRCGEQKIKETSDFAGNSFLKLHAEEDVSHLDRAFQQIEQLSEKDQRDVLANAIQAADLYRSMTLEIEEYALKGVRLRSA